MNGSEWNVPLSKELAERLSVEVRSTRGFPGLVGEIQGRMAEGRLKVDEAFVDKIWYHAFMYGRGPWQMLLRDLLEEIDAFSSGERPDNGVRERRPSDSPSFWRDDLDTTRESGRTQLTVSLSEGLLERLLVGITDTRGFPGFVREIQGRIADGVLTADDAFIEKLEYHAFMYGRGPWPLLLRDVVDEIRAASAVP